MITYLTPSANPRPLGAEALGVNIAKALVIIKAALDPGDGGGADEGVGSPIGADPWTREPGCAEADALTSSRCREGGTDPLPAKLAGVSSIRGADHPPPRPKPRTSPPSPQQHEERGRTF